MDYGFEPIEEPTNHDSADGVAEETCPCPVGATRAPTEFRELDCLEYLSNFNNVVKVRPMLSNIKFGRTVKMLVEYRHRCVRGIVKTPQSLFPLEPYSEYAAYELDRMLRLGYVPPTTWLFVPVAELEMAGVGFRNGGDDDKEYQKWLAEEVLMYVGRNGLSVVDKQGRLVVGCSVQLMVSGARWQRKTPLDLMIGT